MEISKKMRFFLMSQGSINPKIRFLGQKVCSVAHLHTGRHESDYCGHPFRVSGVFPSTYHQGSAQLHIIVFQIENIIFFFFSKFSFLRFFIGIFRFFSLYNTSNWADP